VLGPRIDDWRSRDLINAPVSLSIDGALVGSATLSSMLDGPFGALAFLARLLKNRGKELTVGTWISTGAITGVHRISADQLAVAVFDDQFEASCRTIAFAAPAPNGERS
jgi:2-keto-4-pentenoate hydratase